MSGSDRRTFLKMGAASAASALVLTQCEPASQATSRDSLDASLLRALGDAVLPGELGADGRERVVTGFESWLAGYEPVPELMHGYGSQEIRYGPGDPAPRWSAQLAALDIEARKRWSAGFAEAAHERRQMLVRRQLANSDLERLPNPSRVEHVGAALLAYWLATPAATNLCYNRKIDRESCRALETSPEEPPRLDAVEA